MSLLISDVKFIARYVVGNSDAEKVPDEAKIKKQLDVLNSALSRGGKIIAQEKNFYILNIGEHQVVAQYAVYHVGFERKPYWYKDKKEEQICT